MLFPFCTESHFSSFVMDDSLLRHGRGEGGRSSRERCLLNLLGDMGGVTGVNITLCLPAIVPPLLSARSRDPLSVSEHLLSTSLRIIVILHILKAKRE